MHGQGQEVRVARDSIGLVPRLELGHLRTFVPTVHARRQNPQSNPPPNQSTPTPSSATHRKGESLSAKAPVDLGRAKSKPYWDLMTREEAGKRWRAAFGDAPGAVPSEQEAKRRAAKAAAKAAADVEGAEKR